ncbi:MAG: hypothetical protein VCA36_02865 [Opitutales bacterium]
MKSRMFPFALALALFASLSSAEEPDNLRFAKILSDNLVLQQGKPITVWGWAEPETVVKVTLTQDSATGQKAETESGLENKADEGDDYSVSVRYVENNPPRLQEKTLSAKADKEGRWSVSSLLPRPVFSPLG